MTGIVSLLFHSSHSSTLPGAGTKRMLFNFEWHIKHKKVAILSKYSHFKDTARFFIYHGYYVGRYKHTIRFNSQDYSVRGGVLESGL